MTESLNNIDARRRTEELFQMLEIPNQTDNKLLHEMQERARCELADKLEQMNGHYLIDLCLEYRKRGKDGYA